MVTRCFVLKCIRLVVQPYTRGSRCSEGKATFLFFSSLFLLLLLLLLDLGDGNGSGGGFGNGSIGKLLDAGGEEPVHDDHRDVDHTVDDGEDDVHAVVSAGGEV